MEELELYLRKKIDDLNKMAVFDIATETLKIWLDDYKPALSQHDVSNRREQLIAFADMINIYDGDKNKIEGLVDLYLKSN